MSKQDISFLQTPSMIYGKDFTVKQIQWNSNKHKHDFWKCLKCGNIWKGARKLRWQNRKPTRCPKCMSYNRIKAVKQ